MSTSARARGACGVLEVEAVEAAYGPFLALSGVTLRVGPGEIVAEPSLGLAPRIVETILGVIGEINRGGVSILLVEQNVQAALGLAHRAYILEAGRVAGEGSGPALLQDPHVRRAYLGPLASLPGSRPPLP